MDLTRQLEAAIRLIDRWLAYKVYLDQSFLRVTSIHQDKLLLSDLWSMIFIWPRKQAYVAIFPLKRKPWVPLATFDKETIIEFYTSIT